jgi:hypothetical protein
MSYHARNHLQDNWGARSLADSQARTQTAEAEAGWYFDQATRHAKAEFDAAIHALLDVTGPRANRARDSAKANWDEATRAPRALFEATVDCLLTSGEVSAELDDAWTALIDGHAVTMAAE